MSRRCRRSSVGASSRSVWACIRKRNRVLTVSSTVNASCSSLISRSSEAFIAGNLLSIVNSLETPLSRATPHHAHADRHLMSEPREAQLRLLLGHSGQLEHHGPLFDDGNPMLRLAFALAHAGFQRTPGDRLVREDADVK